MAYAMGHPVKKPLQNPSAVKPIVARPHPSWHTINYHAPRRAVPRYLSASVQRAYRDWPFPLVDATGHFTHSLHAGTVQQWKQKLHEGGLSGHMQARLHLSLGEQLIGAKYPEAANWHFRAVERIMPHTSPFYGRAAFDLALARYRSGEYGAAARAWQRLLKPGTHLCGFDFRNAALMERHAQTCSGYHHAHRRLGIPEPSSLDPLCGAAALAVCLRSLHEKYARSYVACRVPHTGEGSTLADLKKGARTFGLVPAEFSLQSLKNVRSLPLPCIAFVEHDHFVAVTNVNAQGVAYI